MGQKWSLCCRRQRCGVWQSSADEPSPTPVPEHTGRVSSPLFPILLSANSPPPAVVKGEHSARSIASTCVCCCERALFCPFRNATSCGRDEDDRRVRKDDSVSFMTWDVASYSSCISWYYSFRCTSAVLYTHTFSLTVQWWSLPFTQSSLCYIVSGVCAYQPVVGLAVECF